MSWPDVINGSFELAGAVAGWRNVLALYRAKQVRGVDPKVWVLLTLWGLWNLFYYPSLHQWLSLTGGVVLVSANATWVLLACRYDRRTP